MIGFFPVPRRWRVARGLPVLVGCLAFLPVGAPAQEFSFESTWATNYVSEGRRHLESDGFFSALLAGEASGVALSIWHGYGHGDRYREWNFALGRGFNLGPVECAIHVTRLEFRGSADGHDNELGLDLAYEPARDWKLSLACQWSSEARGTFLVAQVSREIALQTGDGVLRPYACVGFDFGYASEAYDGPNHIEAGLQAEWPVASKLRLGAQIAWSHALGDVRRDGGRGFAWGGVTAMMGF